MVRNALVALAASLSLVVPAHAATYKIDPDHSEVGFKVRHLTISNVNGRFAEFTGTFDYDPANLSSSKTNAEIAVKSVDTKQAKRDDHLKGDDFFSAQKFPMMKFVSKTVTPVSKDSFKLTGDLTIRDITKPVTLEVTPGGVVKDPWGNERAAFAATTTINRKDFGLTYNKALETGGLVVGDEVQISLSIEGVKQS